MRIIIFFVLWILVLAVTGCIEKPKKQLENAQITKQIKLSDMEGNTIDLDQYRGKAVFINVWATWCKPCIEEMPSIKSAQATLPGKDIEFLFASNEEKERIESFEEKRKFNLRYVQLENLEELQIQVLPVTYILNKEGELVFQEAGYRKWDDPANIQLLTKIIEGNE